MPNVRECVHDGWAQCQTWCQKWCRTKKRKMFDFFKFFIFSIVNLFFIKNGVILWVLNGAKNDYFGRC